MNTQRYDFEAEARRQRRGYLWAVTRAWAMGIAGLLFLVVFGLLTALSGAGFVLLAIGAPGLLFIGVFVLAFTGYYAYAGGRDFRAAGRRLQQIPYVPPVREQLAARPAEEVLLRGSSQPAAQPNELLRAGAACELTSPEELLRAGENTGP